MGRKIAIFGAGAVGGYAGAHMVQAGEVGLSSIPGPSMSSTCGKQGFA